MIFRIKSIEKTRNGEIIIWECINCGAKTWTVPDFPIEESGCPKCHKFDPRFDPLKLKINGIK